jgi:anti-sigma B factor antagonist
VGPDGSDPPVFSLDVAPGEDGRTAVAVGGELDLASADEFAGAVRAALASGPVVVDLSQVTFMDSAGVRVLNALVREAAEDERELRIASEMQPGVVQVLELTGMMQLLPLQERR